MKIIIFGGTGFIGRALLQLPYFRDKEVFVVTRSPEKNAFAESQNIKMVPANETLESHLLKIFSGQYGIINLAGESLSNWPWTKKQRNRILSSRVRITNLISNLVNSAKTDPAFIIQSSAIGFYGFEHKGKITEKAGPGHSYLAQVCQKWEEALTLEKTNKSRVVIIRTGLVLGNEGGLLKVLKLPFYFFAGGHFGSGKQMASWIHIDDEINAIEFLIKSQNAQGPFNLVAPEPVSMKVLMKTIGKRMKRPSWFHVPAFLLRMILGSTFANELILGGQDVIPEKLQESDFKFKFPNIDGALSDLI